MIINDKRALAYIAVVHDIRPIAGADNIELVHILGWQCIAKKNEFQEGDKAVYFEIDSKVPASDARFAFMSSKHYNVKTYKLNKFGVIGQGLAMPASVFPEVAELEVGTDVTELLGVTYSIVEDNIRKSSDRAMEILKSRKPKLFKNRFIKWLMKRRWGRWLVMKLWGSKTEKATAFPSKFEYIKKTDQERVENMPWVLNDKTPFIKTQKCDGSSGTFILERVRKNKFKFYVCSRNVRQLKPSQKCWYDENIYWEMAIKYDIENVLKKLMKTHTRWKYCCFQGEICGPKIQGNPHHLPENDLFIFHFIDSEHGKWDIRVVKKMCDDYGLKTVPISDDNYILPDDLESLKQDAVYYYDSSCCNGDANCLAEGYVYYSSVDPNFSFKNVSRQYLLK